MKITICGSITFLEEMQKIKEQLEFLGHEVKLPVNKLGGEHGELVSAAKYYDLRQDTPDKESWIWNRKKEAILEHYKKEEWCDVVLVLNLDKNRVGGYVGGNTLMEMGLAIFLNKKIYLYNPVPELPYKEEILGCKPVVIHGDLTLI